MNGDGLGRGSTIQTILDPAASHSCTFSSTDSGRSLGESTSTARSGAKGMCLSGFVISGSRSARTNATSGPRTVSGSRSIKKPVSAAKAAPRRRPSDVVSDQAADLQRDPSMPPAR